MPVHDKRFVVRFSGHVQGVGFRATAIGQARGLSIDGFVRNEADGSVLMDVDGPERDLRKLVANIRTVMSEKIDSVDVQELDSMGRQDGFGIQW